MPGENIYPVLFAIFLNDLRKYFEEIDLDGVKSITSDLEYVLTVFLSGFFLLYAGDTIYLKVVKIYKICLINLLNSVIMAI